MYDSRLKINAVDITALIDEGAYIIELSIGIPSISDEEFKISSILSQNGYEII
jgi:hypothetical protein